MLTSPWNDTEFVKAKADDPLLGRLSEATASFLVNNGLPKEADYFHFNLDRGLRTMQSALLENGGPEHVRQLVDNLYARRKAPRNLIAIGRFGGIPENGFARYVCIDTDANDKVVLFSHMQPRKKPSLINSSIGHFFALLSILESLYADNPYDVDDKSYVRYYTEMARSMRTAMIAAEVPGFDFDKSWWIGILKSIRQGIF